MAPNRVLVGLSGGVDSAVAAALLLEQGVDVIGATLRLWHPLESERGAKDRPIDRARRVADYLGIPFHLIDARESFETHVMRYFVSEYAGGRTPNPCVVCNRLVRFDLLLDRAEALGAEVTATGHYARVTPVGNAYQLLRGRDRRKDQSYFLHGLDQAQLARVRFPLGELRKEETRRIARRRNLPVAGQPDSQDVCFLVDGDYRRFLSRQSPQLFRPGPIRDTAGRVLGQHQGLPGYTIGQRRGLGVSADEPLYVLAIRPEDNALVVGPAHALERADCLVEGVRYISGRAPGKRFRASAQIRYRAPAAPVKATPLVQGRVRVVFDAPQRALTPGQFLVFYDEADPDRVLGGGTICGAQQSML
jgi:tRNA-uridine 2-sulfurtransferase